MQKWWLKLYFIEDGSGGLSVPRGPFSIIHLWILGKPGWCIFYFFQLLGDEWQPSPQQTAQLAHHGVCYCKFFTLKLQNAPAACFISSFGCCSVMWNLYSIFYQSCASSIPNEGWIYLLLISKHVGHNKSNQNKSSKSCKILPLTHFNWDFNLFV